MTVEVAFPRQEFIDRIWYRSHICSVEAQPLRTASTMAALRRTVHLDGGLGRANPECTDAAQASWPIPFKVLLIAPLNRTELKIQITDTAVLHAASQRYFDVFEITAAQIGRTYCR
jgi:hypothetical protein